MVALWASTAPRVLRGSRADDEDRILVAEYVVHRAVKRRFL
jgi:hypothetical protein